MEQETDLNSYPRITSPVLEHKQNVKDWLLFVRKR